MTISRIIVRVYGIWIDENNEVLLSKELYKGNPMTKFSVSSKKEDELRRRMAECGLEENDLEEKFIRSGGPGGQHVNRTATCVYLKHGPTGTEVKMQKARSQALNRFYARRRMCELLEEKSLGAQSPKALRQEKIRRQKSRRRRRGKAKAANIDETDSERRDSSSGAG